MHPSIAVRDGEIFVVWEDEREGASNIYFSKSTRKNGSLEFSRNIRVNDINGRHYDPQIVISGDNIHIAWQAEINDAGDIYFSNGKYNGRNPEFSRSIKVNDDLTGSFTKPNPVFVGIVLGSVTVSMILAAYLRRKNEK
ncbi:MAG: hypothetical protein SCH70_12105 [Candidatus Methanoperedens sp.]|nr:hypothetical protein [Candidatus Methanoperedens sp.]